MKLEVGLYFRTKGGTIGKIDSMTEDGSEIYFDTKPIFSDEEEFGSKWCYATDIIKASHNIIDLIEVGDYVNGVEVTKITNNEIMLADNPLFIDKKVANKLIKTILTHESFENNCYKIGNK